jgi:hypothetical protein
MLRFLRLNGSDASHTMDDWAETHREKPYDLILRRSAQGQVCRESCNTVAVTGQLNYSWSNATDRKKDLIHMHAQCTQGMLIGQGS